ncbi:Rne/Rng family ribonuclease, partial [uncultured Sphingomonas sp.]|uniref:Rne/Rng family ribonuclease n=1 Tax=uncultured Sphingomonas sp. TaxID=158754 RepID=UPI0035CC567F
SNAGDRKRLKTIMAELALPSSMGCIVRTAGLQRTKVEIKRDFDYLARLWDGIRENTLSSSAPALIYGDSDLIKRAIRDIYNREIDEVVVEGEEGYRQAKEFMKLLMPSHARKVKHYSDAVPLFQRAHVEEQLAAMYHPVVQLKSGGYLVINPTEALVSIDINSGRSTREHSIEQTATATNLEAAQEIARQLRLRDMAGLVVIDFIDMDNNSNVRKVEKCMKEALKNDRARIQVGRISSFGLMEMSRQRLRTGVLEASTRACPHCEGTGLVRTASSAGLSALRLIEDEAARGRGSLLTLRASQEAAIYVLNRKRADIAEIEDRYGVHVEILPDREEEGAHMSVEASGPPPSHAPRFEAAIEDIEDDIPEDIELDEEEEVADDEAEERSDDRAPRQPRADRESQDGDGQKRRRRRRGRRNRNRPDEGGEAGDSTDETAGDETAGADEPGAVEETEEYAGETPAHDQTDPQEGGEGRRRRGRRGRRGGRRSGGAETNAPAAGEDDGVETALPLEEPADAGDSGPVTSPLDIAAAAAEAKPDVPKTRRRPRARSAAPVAPVAADAAPVETPVEPDADAPAKPRRGRRKAAAAPAEAEAAPEPAAAIEAEAVAAEAPKRRGRPRKAAAETVVEAPAEAVPTDSAPADTAPAANDAESEDGEGDTPRRGWWQRTFGA